MKFIKNRTVWRLCLSVTAFCFIIVFAEFISKIFPFQRTPKEMIFSIIYRPYVGFINQPYFNNNYKILNQFSKTEEQCQRSTNNWGFREDFDYTYFLTKKANTKCVLILGGSAVGGAGSTSDNKVIDAILQNLLNENSQTTYVVYNFGNGGWISFQEVLGVLLFGFYLKPDWIITMNGRNDVAVGIGSREGPLGFKHNAIIESYIKGYLQYGMNSSFYRGELENWIIQKSNLYKMLTGKHYIPKSQNTFTKYGKIYTGQSTSWQNLDEIILLYLKNIEILERLFPTAKFIFSLQPLCHSKNDIFVKLSSKQIQDQIDKGPDIDYHTAIQYFYTNLINKKTSTGNKIIYAGDAFSEEFDPQKYFLDEAHLTDHGAEKVAELYSRIILNSEQKKP
jgi:hypothetical protein